MQELVCSANAPIMFQLCTLALMFWLTGGLVVLAGHVLTWHQPHLL